MQNWPAASRLLQRWGRHEAPGWANRSVRPFSIGMGAISNHSSAPIAWQGQAVGFQPACGIRRLSSEADDGSASNYNLRKARVLATVIAKTIKLPLLQRILSQTGAGRRWFVSHVPDALILSQRPQEVPVREGTRDERPFARQASHVVVHRRGSVVLINCDVAAARDILSVLMDTSRSVATPLSNPTLPENLLQSLRSPSTSTSAIKRVWSSFQQAVSSLRTGRLARGNVSEATTSDSSGAAESATAAAGSTKPVTGVPAAFTSAHLARQWMGAAAPNSGGGALGAGSNKPVDFMTVGTDGSIPIETWAHSVDGALPIVVRRLDLPSVWLVSSAMAHSVTLQQAERAVDGLHEAMVELNNHVARGAAGKVPRAALHSLRARITVLRDSVYLFNQWSRTRTALSRNATGEGLLETHSGHDALADLLEDELELDRRQTGLEAALEHADSSVKYVIHEQEEGRMHRLEVLIVQILMLELAFTLWELWEGGHAAGHGEAAAHVVDLVQGPPQAAVEAAGSVSQE